MPTLFDPITLQPISMAAGIVAATVLVCVLMLLTRWGWETYEGIEKGAGKFAKRRLMASSVLFVSVIGIRLIALPLLPVPTPGIHDEFSYLLIGDTLVHGRLANPAHPMWLSLETFHVNWFPTYSSMYPPAQGAVLAAGELAGHPWIGVLLSIGGMCVAIFWALQAWMPSRWAYLAAIIAALKFGISSYWINSYWGGAAAAIGGALVIGGLGRIRKGGKARDAVWMAIGVAILANSRPYEGLFFCVPAAVWLVYRAAQKIGSQQARIYLRNTLLPGGCILLLTAGFMGYYNWRLTGNALMFPHTLNERTYQSTPLFLWQSLKPKRHYNNMAFQVFYNGWERSESQRDWIHAEMASKLKVDRFNVTYLWSGALLLLPALPFLVLDRKMRMLLATLAVGLPPVFAVVWSQSHYLAPLTCVIYALLVQAIRHLRTMRVRSLQLGIGLSRVTLLLLLLDTGMHLCNRVCDPLLFACSGNPDRAAVVRQLEHLPGKHLIIVHYAELHNPHNEWVFNGADIDGGKIVWARDMGPTQNEKLLAYFHERRVWTIMADGGQRQVSPYYAAPLAAKQE